jgi:hypothetical protein
MVVPVPVPLRGGSAVIDAGQRALACARSRTAATEQAPRGHARQPKRAALQRGSARRARGCRRYLPHALHLYALLHKPGSHVTCSRVCSDSVTQ